MGNKITTLIIRKNGYVNVALSCAYPKTMEDVKKDIQNAKIRRNEVMKFILHNKLDVDKYEVDEDGDYTTIKDGNTEHEYNLEERIAMESSVMYSIWYLVHYCEYKVCDVAELDFGNNTIKLLFDGAVA